MKVMAQKSLQLTVGGLLLSLATASAAVPFRPYADITVNTYWDQQTQDIAPMKLDMLAQKHGIKAYRLAFITTAPPVTNKDGTIESCQPAWGGQSSYSLEQQWGKHLADRLHTQGIEISPSFGGAAGQDISAACTQDQLTKIFEKTVETYHAQSLDFDIENGTANTPKLIAALKEFQSTHPQIPLIFTLAVLPEGLTDGPPSSDGSPSSGKQIIRLARATNLNFRVNIMAMDYGPYYHQASMGDYAKQAATSVFQFLREIYPTQTEQKLWSMIEVTPMIGLNDVTVEQFTLQDTDVLKQFAQEKQLGGLSMWSIARDNPCADQLPSAICSSKNLQTREFEFSERFVS